MTSELPPVVVHTGLLIVALSFVTLDGALQVAAFQTPQRVVVKEKLLQLAALPVVLGIDAVLYAVGGGMLGLNWLEEIVLHVMPVTLVALVALIIIEARSILTTISVATRPGLANLMLAFLRQVRAVDLERYAEKYPDAPADPIRRWWDNLHKAEAMRYAERAKAELAQQGIKLRRPDDA